MPQAPSFNPNWAKRDHPVVNISWFDAKKYSEWAGDSLPTEAQWEKAARGTDGRLYPWGNDWDGKKLWCSEPIVDRPDGTSPVGGFTDSPFGLSDMVGNGWQWCADDPDGTGSFRILRGVSPLPNFFRAANRNWEEPTFKYKSIGFRCALPA